MASVHNQPPTPPPASRARIERTSTTDGGRRCPTLTARATQMGMILGTAAYMSPEQAKGRPVDLSPNMSDEGFEYVFNVAEALGCTHTTLELPTDEAQLTRIGEFAMKRKIYAAYHTHLQGSMAAFDRAFALSPGNMANVDLGHYVAAGNVGGTPVEFLEKHHARVSSVHLKDRRSKDNGGDNLPWGTGDTPLKDILQTMKRRQWRFPASVELEYRIPDGSTAVIETTKCVQFCAEALA